MKAAVLYGNYDMRYEEYPEPEVSSGCVKVKVCACGICGSDIPRITNNGAHYYPIVLGHEFGGYVVEIGEGVEGISVGDHVVVAPLIPCMSCPDCINGYYSQCKHYSFIGSRVQGAYADYVVAPAMNVVRIDESIPYERAALFEPATVALHGLKRVDYHGGKKVAVLGGGTIGLFVLQWAKIYGAEKVVVFDLDNAQLELAKRLGADEVVNTLDKDFLATAMQYTMNAGYDYVFETAGSTVTMKLCFELVANHGSVCMVGTPTKDITFTPAEWEKMNRKEFRLTGSWMSGNAPYPGDEWSLVSHFFANGALKFDDDIFYCKIPLSQPEKLTEILKDRSRVKGRILFVNE